jgi:hypothetical protein
LPGPEPHGGMILTLFGVGARVRPPCVSTHVRPVGRQVAAVEDVGDYPLSVMPAYVDPTPGQVALCSLPGVHISTLFIGFRSALSSSVRAIILDRS